MIKDLTVGIDIRGDDALFIESIHFLNEWEFDKITQKKTQGLSFFRVIEDGIQQHQHGWVENGKIVQWG